MQSMDSLCSEWFGKSTCNVGLHLRVFFGGREYHKSVYKKMDTNKWCNIASHVYAQNWPATSNSWPHVSLEHPTSVLLDRVPSASVVQESEILRVQKPSKASSRWGSAILQQIITNPLAQITTDSTKFNPPHNTSQYPNWDWCHLVSMN